MEKTKTSYSLTRRLSVPYFETVKRVKDALKDEGFGVLTEIDVHDTLRGKLDKDFRRYDIIGACNPQLAYRALQAEIDVGLLLPCNVVVYEDDGGSVVSVFDPRVALGLSENSELAEVGEEARARLQRVLEHL